MIQIIIKFLLVVYLIQIKMTLDLNLQNANSVVHYC